MLWKSRTQWPLLTAVLALAVSTPVARGQAVLEDFSTQRWDGAGIPLFSLMEASDSQGSFTVTGGVYRQTVNSGAYKFIMHFVPIPGTGARYPYPDGYAQGWIKSGAWDPTYNRLRFKMKCSKTVTRDPNEWATIHFGTYSKSRYTDPDSQGSHYYHFFNPNFYAGRWITFEVNRVPQHSLAGGFDGNNNLPENPTSSAGVNYFDGLTRFYIDSVGNGTSSWPWNGATCELDDFVFSKESGEPDTLVAGLTWQYTGSRYEVTWNGPRRVPTTYEVRYSTQSMKANGFNSGTDGGTARNSATDYPGVFWASPPMAEASTMYVAIRPQGQSAFSEVMIGGSGTAPAPPTSRCDVNSDGATNDSDVNLAIDQALGKSGCTVDLDSNGRCDVVDVQRVANAANGQTCRVGQ